jgi:hypothetical protein
MRNLLWLSLYRKNCRWETNEFTLFRSIFAGDSCLSNPRLYQGLPSREFPVSEISDSSCSDAMLKGRYDVLASGREIRWGGIDKEKQQNTIHDDRPGTLHIAALEERSEDGLCNKHCG